MGQTSIRLPIVFALLLVLGAAAPGPPIPPGAQNPSFNLVNRTSQPIRELFVTPAGNANWGQNRLDGRAGNPTSIAANGSFTVRRRADNNCIFDIRVVFADGRSEERKGLNTCALEEVMIGTAAPSHAPNAATGKAADDPSVRLFNRAAVAITEFYAAPAGLGDWGQNRLDKTPLPPDQSRQMVLPRDGNCIYDLRVVFADRKAREKKRTNLCRVAELPVP
jgi:hypothetical protein